MTEDDVDADIVELFPEVERPAVLVRGPTYRSCRHRQIELDVDLRVGICRSCDAHVDVFDWLIEHAGKRWGALWSRHKAMKKDLSRMAKLSVDLQREVKNLKAQVKRWREKAER